MPTNKQSSVDHLWVWLTYLMVFGGWSFVALATVGSGWAPEVIGAVTVAVGSVVGGYVASRQSPRQRLNEPAIGAALVAATLVGVAHFTETGAHHGGNMLVAVALVGALVGALVAHRVPGRGGPATRVRGILISTLICCGCWAVMYFALEAWDHGISDAEGAPVLLAIIVTIFGCGAVCRLAMPAASRWVVASGGFFCPVLFLAIALLVKPDEPETPAFAIYFGVTFFGVVNYGCAWVGAWLTGRYLASRPEPPPLPAAAVRDG